MTFVKRLKGLFGRIAGSGLPESADIEVQRKVFLVNLFCTVGFLCLLLSGINSLLINHPTLAAVTLGNAGITLANFLFLRYTGNYRRSGDVVVLVMCTVFVYLICSGGVDRTGPLWCYAAVPLILFMYGSAKGLPMIGALALFSAAVMLIPDMPLRFVDYGSTFSVRFLASFAVVVSMSSLYEYAREQSYRQMRRLHEISNQEARTDALTGLSNRRHMYECIENICVQTDMRDHKSALLLCDIDNFKALNDRYGHHCGDDALVQVARILKATLRGEDAVSRWGGEEFLIALPDTDLDAAQALAEKIRRRIEESVIVCNGERFHTTLSIGVHAYRPEWSLEANLTQVDRSLYRAKDLGRNRVCVQMPNTAATA